MPTGKLYTREICRLPAARLPQNFIQQLPESFPRCGRIIHNARNQIRVYSFKGKEINVKKFCIPPIVNRILYSIGWRIPKAKTTFLNAQEILKRGFHTPRPFGYLIERSAGLINYSYFISEQVQGFTPIRRAENIPALIKALAEYTAKLHQAGLMHRDYTPGNILYREENGAYTFMLVDINRFRIQNKPICLWFSVRNLMKPFEDDKWLESFVTEYAKRRNLNVRFCIWYVLFLRHTRNCYDTFKRMLKHLPFAYLFLNKPLGEK